jgi:N-acetylmuramoyl-L-alanine amidase
MCRRALALTLLVFLAPVPAAGAGRAARARPAAAAPARAAAKGARAPSLAEAKAAMSAVMRDPAKRRYRHQWEKGIRGLLRAARGKEAPAATLEAARARYALYRWSANEADREAAVALATKAARLGSKDAPALARAIRKEAGEPAEERPAPASPRRRAPAPQPPATATAKAPRAPARAPTPEPEPPARPEPEDDSPPDPALEAALADRAPSAASAHPLGTSGGDGPARVSEVRSWASEDYTRVAVYLSHWTGFL